MGENATNQARPVTAVETGADDVAHREVVYPDAGPFELAAQGHHLTFHPSGPERLVALLDLIANAERSVELVFYIFEADRAGSQVRDALVEAAGRGVAVHLIVDAFGIGAPSSFFDPLVAAGGKFDLFQPRWNVRYLIRNHQKMVIVDRQRAMTGGFNIADDYFAPADEDGWSDLGVLVEGPVVAQFADWFRELEAWVSDKGSQFRAIRQLVREWDPGDGPVQLVVGGPTRVPNSWVQRVKDDLARGVRLDMVMAYFSPSRSIRELIQGIAKRGAARLVMAGKTDNGATIGASRALYSRLQAAGTQIAEFAPTKLHSKLLVIDDVTYVGSANMDMRSVRLNLELMLRIEDKALAQRMRELIDHMQEHSLAITPDLHRQRATWLNRLRWRLCYWLVSVFDYTIARRLNLGL